MRERIPAPPSARRAATSKRERTRELVLRSALECIREEGLVEASAARIAERCGLSWGVIQYHFGDWSGLLMAILERGFESLRDSLSALDNLSSDPFDPLRGLVDGMASLMEHPVHRVHLDVQLEYRLPEPNPGVQIAAALALLAILSRGRSAD